MSRSILMKFFSIESQKFIETWLVIRLMLLGTYSTKRNILITSPRTRRPRRKRKDPRRRESIDSGHHRRARRLVRRRAFLEAARWRVYNLQNRRDAVSPRRKTSSSLRSASKKKREASVEEIETDLSKDRDRSRSKERANERACARARGGKEGRGTRPRRVCRRSTEINPPRGEKRKRTQRIPLSRERRRAFDAWRFAYRARDSARRSRSACVSTWRKERFSTYLYLRRPPQKNPTHRD